MTRTITKLERTALTDGNISDRPQQRKRGWLKFVAGASLLLVIFLILAHSTPPPGTLGEVARHNIQADIDATPLFYSEVENIYEISADIHELLDDGEPVK